MNKIFGGVLIFVFIIVFGLFLFRAFSERWIDDVSPGIDCEDKLLEKADVYYVIPEFEGRDIGNESYMEWCEMILGKGKRIAIHGVYHTYQEFGVTRDSDYFFRGLEAFEECFGFIPREFKAPQLVLNKENKEMLEGLGFLVRGRLGQIFHKTYHCGDSGLFPNWVVDLF